MRMLETSPKQNFGTVLFSDMSPWARSVFLLLLGASFGRSFFYLGIPPAHIFIGEMVLAAFLIFRTDRSLGAWARMLMAPGYYEFFAWCLLVSVLYGAFEVLYGVHSGYSFLTAAENMAFNVYPLYFFLGLWMGEENPTLLKKVFRGLAWILALYGPAYFLILDKIKLNMPGSETPVFSQAGGGGMIILSLLAFEAKPRRYWPLMLIAGMIMLAVQVRAEWCSMVIAFLIWGALEGKMRRVAMVALLVAVLLALGFIADVNIPSPQERGGSISSREIVARGISAVDPSLAQEYTDSKNISFYYGTIYWRTRWWTAIWDSVHEDTTKTLIGNGYGFPLGGLVPYLANIDIRTPHNILLYALGYSGWIGLAIFLTLQLSLLLLTWKTYRLTGRSWPLAFFASGLISAFFGNALEAPMGAIPFYLMLGLAVGPALGQATDRLTQRASMIPGYLDHGMSGAHYTPALVRDIRF
jgi:hypothetical protein